MLTRAVAIGLVFAGVVRAQQPSEVEVLHASSASALTIRGSTTIGARWHCTASGVDARLAIVPPAAADTGIPEVRGVAVQVPVSALRCQSGAMERAMREALKVHQDSTARTITGRFEIYDSIPAASRSHPLLVGGLRVAGAERNVLLRAAVTRHPDGAMRVRSVVPLLLSEFGIVPPRVLFGAVRARDAVSVEIELHYAAGANYTDPPGSPRSR